MFWNWQNGFHQAMESFRYVCEQNGFDLIGPNHKKRFEVAFEFIWGVLVKRDGIDLPAPDAFEIADGLNESHNRIEAAIERLLDWHETEIFAESTSEHFAKWAGMYIVLADYFGYDIRPDHEFLPENFLASLEDSELEQY